MTLKNAKKIYFTLVAAVTVSGFLTVCTLGQAVRIFSYDKYKSAGRYAFNLL